MLTLILFLCSSCPHGPSMDHMVRQWPSCPILEVEGKEVTRVKALSSAKLALTTALTRLCVVQPSLGFP